MGRGRSGERGKGRGERSNKRGEGAGRGERSDERGKEWGEPNPQVKIKEEAVC